MEVGATHARWWKILIAALSWIGLALQFCITLGQFLATGRAVGEAIAFYLSFFTILTNLLVASATTLSSVGTRSRLGRFSSQPAVLTAIAIYIAVVGVVYSLVLRDLWAPTGSQKVADLLLHDLVPIVYVAFWIFCVPKNALRWRHAFWYLSYPLVYLIYTLIRGWVTKTYPYPFLDVGVIGYGRMLANVAVLLTIFLGMGLAIVAISHKRGQSKTS